MRWMMIAAAAEKHSIRVSTWDTPERRQPPRTHVDLFGEFVFVNAPTVVRVDFFAEKQIYSLLTIRLAHRAVLAVQRCEDSAFSWLVSVVAVALAKSREVCENL